MKFSLSLKYNSVPEWQDKYINYSNLKKLVYNLQAQQLNNTDTTKGDITGVSEGTGSSADLNNEELKKSGETRKKLKNALNFKRKRKNSFNQTTFELDDMNSLSSFNAENFDPSKIFLEKLETELLKIDEFYKLKEHEFFQEYEALIADLENSKIHLNMDKSNAYFNDNKSILSHKSSINEAIINASNSFNLEVSKDNTAVSTRSRGAGYDEESSIGGKHDLEDDEDEELDHSDSENSALLSETDLNMKSQNKITLKKRTTQLYVDLSQLKSFIELNKMGFNKITKKFDKSLSTSLKPALFDTNEFFKDSYTFSYHTLASLDDKINNLVEVFASLTNRLNRLEDCKAELRSFLREHIVWERNTVWKDMIGIETRTNGLKGVSADATQVNDELYNLDYYSWKLPYPVDFKFTKWENFKLPKFLNTARTYKLVIIIAITAVLLGVKTFNDEAEHRCMALLACVALLWATEAIPLFVTAILCPLLVVLFRVVKDSDGHVMAAPESSAYILGKMWSSTIMVLLGGFALAAALSKYNIAKVFASYILAFSGTKPRNILLSIMSVALFLSMWISNVATPVLCYSLIQGVLRTLPTDSPFAKALILGVALASNIAGMSSPISSPQNIVAMTYLSEYGIGWGQWLGVALPVSIISLILTWILLIFTFNISKTKVMKYKPIKEKFTIKQWFIIVVTIGTILLWCVLTKLETTFGESGEVAIIPIVLFFGTGLLSTADINNFPWSIVILAMGSLALGKAVSSSGLLATIAKALQKKVMDFDIYVVLIIFGILILVIATFVSHTVSAIIIIPLVKEIGDSLPGNNSAVILIFAIALLASSGMGLASSGFPNVTAISMTDELGNRYLNVNTFITRGVPASLIAYIVVITVGYGIMKSIA